MKESERNDTTTEVIGRISVLEGKISEHDRIFDMICEEIRGLREYIDGRIEDTNRRIGDLNTRLEETNKRIGGMNERIDSLRLSVDKKIDDTNMRIDSNFKWMLGIQIAMWITIMSAILLH